MKAEIPGVQKNDIDVNIDGGVVSISAKAERNRELKEGVRVVRRGCYSGMISRTFALACDIDEASASAQYQDGVLTLILLKKQGSPKKRLQVS